MGRWLIGIAAVALLTFQVVFYAHGEVTHVELTIDGLSCPFCVSNIEKPLKKVSALESFRTNYKQGLVEAKVRQNQPLDLGQLRQAVAETGFTLRAIRVTAIGTIGNWEGHPILEARGTGQRFLLFQEKGETSLTPQHTIADPVLEQKLKALDTAATLVQVVGTVHEHQGLPPALAIESMNEVMS